MTIISSSCRWWPNFSSQNVFFETKTHWKVCPIIKINSRERCDLVVVPRYLQCAFSLSCLSESSALLLPFYFHPVFDDALLTCIYIQSLHNLVKWGNNRLISKLVIVHLCDRSWTNNETISRRTSYVDYNVADKLTWLRPGTEENKKKQLKL